MNKKLLSRSMGALGGAVGVPVAVDMGRGVSFITEPMASSIETGFKTNYIPGAQLYADIGEASRGLGVPGDIGPILAALGLAGTGVGASELAKKYYKLR